MELMPVRRWFDANYFNKRTREFIELDATPYPFIELQKHYPGCYYNLMINWLIDNEVVLGIESSDWLMINSHLFFTTEEPMVLFKLMIPADQMSVLYDLQ